jgi:alanine racemase
VRYDHYILSTVTFPHIAIQRIKKHGHSIIYVSSTFSRGETIKECSYLSTFFHHLRHLLWHLKVSPFLLSNTRIFFQEQQLHNNRNRILIIYGQSSNCKIHLYNTCRGTSLMLHPQKKIFTLKKFPI